MERPCFAFALSGDLFEGRLRAVTGTISNNGAAQRQRRGRDGGPARTLRTTSAELAFGPPAARVENVAADCHRRRRRASVGRLSALRSLVHLGTVFAFQPRYGFGSHSNAFFAAQRNTLRDGDCDVLVRYSSPFNESDVLPDDLSGFVQVALHGVQYAGQTRRIQALFEFQTDAPLLGEPRNHSHACRVAVGADRRQRLARKASKTWGSLRTHNCFGALRRTGDCPGVPRGAPASIRLHARGSLARSAHRFRPLSAGADLTCDVDVLQAQLGQGAEQTAPTDSGRSM